MSVVLSIEDVGPCRKQLKVEVPSPVVEAETQRVVEEFQRSARLPGFRQGKVPAGLIMSKYQEDIEKEVVELLLPRFWRQAEAEKELDPLLPPSVDEVDFQAGQALTFLASVEVRPEIDLGDIETFDLPDMEVVPTPEDLERAIEDMRRAVAEWVDTDRAAAQGDLVVGKLVLLADDEETAPEPQEVRFEVGDQQVWEELSLEVTGKSAGQSGEFERARTMYETALQADPACADDYHLTTRGDPGCIDNGSKPGDNPTGEQRGTIQRHLFGNPDNL